MKIERGYQTSRKKGNKEPNSKNQLYGSGEEVEQTWMSEA